MPSLSVSEKQLRKRIATNTRRLREEKKLSLEETAHLAGMHFRHLQKVEAGEVNATLRTLARLSDAFGVSPHELLL